MALSFSYSSKGSRLKGYWLSPYINNIYLYILLKKKKTNI